MIPCADPKAQLQKYWAEIEPAIHDVANSGQLILGSQVNQFEKEFAKYIDTSFAVGVANGTDALELALRAFGISVGDEVITVSHTAVATVASIEAVGASPVLVDIETAHFTMCPEALREAVTNKTKAIICVHLYGHPAAISEIIAIAEEASIPVIEDVSQAHGATYKGRRLGSFGAMSCFSCYPTKNLGAMGDAGIVATNDPILASRVKQLREYGWQDRVSQMPGRNSRLDEVQAAILRVKLNYLDDMNARRRQIAAQYSEELDGLGVRLPKIRTDCEPAFHLYVISLENRNTVLENLKNHGVLAGIHYKDPVHLQPAYRGRVRVSGTLLNTEWAANSVLSLPMYPELSQVQVDSVIKAFRQSLKM